MELNEYQDEAKTFAMYPDRMYPFLALGEEAGEVLGVLAKAMRKGVSVDKDKIRNELGDVLWNLAACAREYNLTLEEVACYNIQKLKARKKSGTIAALESRDES